MSSITPRRLPWLLLISAAIIFLDRWTKTWVEEHIPLGGPIDHRHGPPPSFSFHISHYLNDGAAFSLFANSASPQFVRWALAGFGSCLVLGVLIALVRLGHSFTPTTVALSFVFGGALGNLHDRILYGSVVDFIEVRIFNYPWPDFNIADSAIVTGACLLLLDSLLTKNSPED